MLRWFEENGCNSDVVISSRVRLARNLNAYNFSLKLQDDAARTMLDETMHTIQKLKEFKNYTAYDFKDLDDYQKIAMRERHVISEFLLHQKEAAGLVSADENLSIMLNEEDHIRIQSFTAGMNLKKAYAAADKVDDELGAKLDYAYDEKYGFLTTCPSNVGTGMRASYMLHLPGLAADGKIDGLAGEIGRFGMMLRGTYGDGNRSMGDIYQISNQITLGISEKEIMDNLTNIVDQVVAQERAAQKQYVQKQHMSAEDDVYRSYGVLRYARKLSLKDCMVLLSELRFGLANHLIRPAAEEDCAIYQLMIGVQPANLQLEKGKNLTDEEIEAARAEFIRDNLPAMQ